MTSLMGLNLSLKRSTLLRTSHLILLIGSLTLLGCPSEVEIPPPVTDAGVTPSSRCPDCRLCSDEEGIAAQIETGRLTFEELTRDLPERPISASRPEATNGTLALGVNPNVVPILSGPAGAFVAASQLGEGRIVAFSSQDFLSSSERSTLLDEPGVVQLIANAVRWVSPVHAIDNPRVLADNFAIAAVIEGSGVESVDVANIRFSQGLEEIRNWDAGALDSVDVLVVQVNEWGTSHVAKEDVPIIRSFVESGGGLLIAGSALHWSWWLHWTSEVNQGDAIVAGSGISWKAQDVTATETARATYDPLGSPAALWCSYVMEEPLDAIQLARMPALFDAAAEDGRSVEMEVALWRLLAETPPLAAAKASPEGRLSANVGALLAAQVWSEPHPWAHIQPGLVATDAPRIDASTIIDTRWKRARPLAVYAPAGEVVTLRIADEFVGTGLKIRLGELHDDLRNLDSIETWERAPLLVRDFALDEAEIRVGTGIGGSLYLLVPDDYANSSVRVETSGGVRQAVYSEGRTTAAEFTADLAGGAPLAIIEQQGKVRLVVASDMAREVSDPSSVMTFWSGFYDSHQALSQEPTARLFESDWLFDPQVGYGYANATPHRINHPKLATGWALRTQTGDEDWWLFAHELGHQFQTSNWSGGDITEVGVNLFSMYTLNSYLNEGGDRETVSFKDNAIDHAALQSLRWGSAGLFEKLELYRQLVFEFGWDVYRQVFASYYSDQYPADRFGLFMDGFAIRFSAIAQRDITPFLVHWEYPLSDEGLASVQSMNLQPWMPPGW
ncbi:MAG: M60 family metallopeptidase [Myxococcota bacterium]|nr:M60 family metallopeptidase [Myxococcota bacterium]